MSDDRNDRTDDAPHETADAEAAEKRVADAIEDAVGIPSSIEEEMLAEAAELEEIEAHVETAVEEAEDAVEKARGAESTGRTDDAAKQAVADAEAEIDDAEAELAVAEKEVGEATDRGAVSAAGVARIEEEIEDAEEVVEEAEEIVEEIAEHLDQRARALEASPLLVEVAAAFPGVRFELAGPDGSTQTVAHVAREQLVDFMRAVRDAGYRMFVDLCGVDYLRRRPRFEVVGNVVSIEPPARLRVRVPVSGDDPSLPSITDVYPGANFYEREAFDMFGIEFEGHPDLTRILMPDEWDGHPLRKDYSVGSVPVQFKGAHKAT